MIIGTWNVAYGRGPVVNRRRVKEMGIYQADVWVLTETHTSLSPGDDYVAFPSCPRPQGPQKVDEKSSWVTIWVHNKHHAEERIGDQRERATACMVEIDGHSVLVYGTVLPWYGDKESHGYEAELAAQQHDWTNLRGDESTLLCVAGDFNMTLGDCSYPYGKKTNRAALLKSMKTSDLEVLSNFERTKVSQPDFGVIAHIAVSTSMANLIKGPRVIRKKNDAGPLSDHTGVVVELDLG